MKFNASNRKKLKMGALSWGLTVVIVSIVIVANVIFSALAQKHLWGVDLTPELLYSLSDDCIALIRDGKDIYSEQTTSPIEKIDQVRAELLAEDPDADVDSVRINIIFCDDPDVVKANKTQRYVYNTALELQEEFPGYINVEHRNIIKNPSSVAKYRETTLTTIDTDSVIVEFGTEYRVRTLRSFFTFNSDSDEEPWAYNGEKGFCAAIMAVTRAFSPIACITTNHGEGMYDDELWQTLEDAGYKVQLLDLLAEDIPQDCRLMVVFDPQKDFGTTNGGIVARDNDEIAKLDAFLDNSSSLMVFVDADTPPLPNFEEFLEEWGIVLDRTQIGEDTVSHMIMDKSQSLDAAGQIFKADYVTTGWGAQLTADMRSRPTPPAIIFSNAISLSTPSTYKLTRYTPEEGSESETNVPYDYYYYNGNGVNRETFDIFVTSSEAQAYAGGDVVERATESNRMSLMTVTKEIKIKSESNYSAVDEASYVIACGSTEFAGEAFLQSGAYGNTDALMTAFRTIGREAVPVGLLPNPFADYTIDTITTSEATQYTVVLATIPAVAALALGIVVIVRRKNR